MKHTLRSVKAAWLLACMLAGSATGAWAQAPAAPPDSSSGNAASALSIEDTSTQPSAQNQRIERLSHEDAGSRVDELRVGGRSKSVTVTPKTGAPAYEIVPNDPSRNRGDNSNGDGSSPTGRRVWKLGNF